MTTDKLRMLLKNKLISEEKVCFAYLFGSQARQDAGKLCDIDIAIYLDHSVDAFRYRLCLMEAIMKIVKNDKVDIIILNNATLLMRHQVVKNGVVLKDDKRLRLDFETQVLRGYHDTEYLRNTQHSYMREHLRAGTYFG
jgi:predicted nucleotidyltransferase